VPTKVTDTILPTTMIGSYPKPRWYTRYNLAGADLLEWWKLEENWHAWWDATTACIKDQELAGLDIVTDGQMHFDDFCSRYRCCTPTTSAAARDGTR